MSAPQPPQDLILMLRAAEDLRDQLRDYVQAAGWSRDVVLAAGRIEIACKELARVVGL